MRVLGVLPEADWWQWDRRFRTETAGLPCRVRRWPTASPNAWRGSPCALGQRDRKRPAAARRSRRPPAGERPRLPGAGEGGDWKGHGGRSIGTNDLYDPRSGDPAIRIERLRLEPGLRAGPHELLRRLPDRCRRRHVWADASQFAFGPDSLLFFVPYQHVRFVPTGPVRGEVVQFHANFLCVETFHAEVGCSGVLFNDPYGVPVVPLDERPRRRWRT